MRIKINRKLFKTSQTEQAFSVDQSAQWAQDRGEVHYLRTNVSNIYFNLNEKYEVYKHN